MPRGEEGAYDVAAAAGCEDEARHESGRVRLELQVKDERPCTEARLRREFMRPSTDERPWRMGVVAQSKPGVMSWVKGQRESCTVGSVGVEEK